MGRRLDFSVENGLYQGKRNAIGYDGIWKSQTVNMLVEIKTTDAYSIDLNTIANYRERLFEEERKLPKNSSILLIVGRQDTGGLEAQVRGSKHAWDMRIISISSLSQLVQIKENSSSESVTIKTHEILIPREYTRVDRIVDLVFTATEDKESNIEDENFKDELEDESDTKGEIHVQNQTPKLLLNKKRQFALDVFSNAFDVNMIKKKQALFSSNNGEIGVCAVVSKRYDKNWGKYWYAMHDYWIDFMKSHPKGFYLIACMDKNRVYPVPFAELEKIIPMLNTSKKKDSNRVYWHIHLNEDENGGVGILLNKKQGTYDIEKYAIEG
jgi:hypothetical protein